MSPRCRHARPCRPLYHCRGYCRSYGQKLVTGPVFGREVVEGEQPITVLGQAFDRFVVLGGVGADEEVEGVLGTDPGLGHPDVPPEPKKIEMRQPTLEELIAMQPKHGGRPRI